MRDTDLAGLDEVCNHERSKYIEGFTTGKARCDKNWARAFYDVIPELGIKTMLDVGCGAGKFVLDMVTRFGADFAYGIDIASVHLGLVPDHPDVIFFDGTAKRLPLPDNHVGWVTSTDMLEHIHEPDVDQVLDEMVRVAHTGLLLTICHRESGEVVQGENLHPTVKPWAWWLEKLEARGLDVEILTDRAARGSGDDTPVICRFKGLA
mgnify:CR=1 FL=1